MIELRQSTAGQEVPLGYFLDSTNGNDEETGLTIANTDIKLWKWGATTLANKNSGGGTHISNGIYYAVLDDTDTNTLGALIIFVHVAGALAVKVECTVLTANAWDSKYSTDKLQVDVQEWLGQACAAVSVNGVPEVDLTHVMGTILSEGGAGRLAAAFIKLFDVVTPLLVASDVMRGTNGANTVVPDAAGVVPTAVENRQEMDSNSTRLDADVSSRAPASEYDTEMGRITGNVALASVVGALNDVAAAGDPTDADTLVQYIKQLLNVLIGTDGIVAFPAEAAPANAVSLAEVIRAIHVDVTGLNGDAMRGTENANTTTPPTVAEIQAELEENGASILDAINDIIADSKIAAQVKGTDDIDLSATQKTSVNAEVVDALAVDTYAEPGDEAPAATNTLAVKIGYLFKFLRNKITNDGSDVRVYNDAEDNVDQKASVSEAAGTVTRGKFGAGD